MTIYLDTNASALLEPGVLMCLHSLFIGEGGFGNPSSVHSFGKKTKKLVKETSTLIEKALGFSHCRVIYTSGATESLNLAIQNIPTGSHVITSSMEHPAVIEPLKQAKLSVTYLDPIPGECVVSLEQIKEAVQSDTSAIVLGWVNSEVGVRIDLEAIAEFAKERQLLLIVDATAIVGKEVIHIPEGVSMVAFSGHKFHALSGIGVLLTSPKIKISPIISGGGQQGGIRSGTEHIHGIASLRYIFSKLLVEQPAIAQTMRSYRDLFESRIQEAFPECIVHCQDKPRVSNLSAIAFPGLEGEVMQIALDLEGVACGYGSACSSGATTVFKSLTVMKVPQDLAVATLRFSFSYLLSEEEILTAAQRVIRVVKHLQQYA
ncbi:cysteine desulfurase [Chlamydia trachomatis]|uniref:Cysteine desulfurase n=2 Tax=Chlamydia trachomatis TaxID=813 RepID=A0A0H3MBV3_CHLT2|nr:cysteine desulfurase family protein [Chlamydia trachomatis]AEJ77529.1 cysteine desulfurase 1 [Chlamydia trachomatis L2c]AGJ64613.1 cysteine desulfurase [Chlamydia trachomatis L2/434/Bu(i)]AGJ65554.1 cysteine desulfurase [Chlamydia trachomatis L2/434/Bu(f)]AGR94594.1 putative cysteine desulfurase [Chlamydia trachomatis RC-L2(s)/46]AGR96473.1 putative cysteine desulfurase [Chlamydia trachomatis RC-J/943]